MGDYRTQGLSNENHNACLPGRRMTSLIVKYPVMTLSQMPLKFRVCPWSALIPRSQLSSYQYPRGSLNLKGKCIHEKRGSHSTSRASGSLLSIGQGLQAPRDLRPKSMTIPSSSSNFFPRDWLIEYPHSLQQKDPTPSTLGYIFSMDRTNFK